MSEHSKSKCEQPNGKHVVPKKFTMPKSFIQGSKPKPEKLSDKEKITHQSKYFIRKAKKETPFYKTGISRSPFNFGDFTETGPGRTKKQNESEVTSHTEENNASLGRSTRQRKIDNLKGKLKDVKAKTMSLASKSEKTGDDKEVAQKYHILSKRDQASRIEKRIARKEGREERKAIRQSLKGKENRGERRKQIIESRQGQRKKVKSINNPKSKVTKANNAKSKTSITSFRDEQQKKLMSKQF